MKALPSSALRVLLIDDDPLFGRVLARKARKQGVRVDHHESLVEALYETWLDRYDAAIVDCCMPGFDGFEVAGYLHRFLERIPVVLVSRADAPFTRYMSNPHGAAAFVSKTQGLDAIIAAATEKAQECKRP